LNGDNSHYPTRYLQDKDQTSELRNENAALYHELHALDRRVTAVERSILFRTLRALGLITNSLTRRAGQRLLNSPLHSFYRRFRAGSSQAKQYVAWLEQHRHADPLAAYEQSSPEHDACFLSVILPTRSPNLDWLRTAVESVRLQNWINWQLCIGEDGELPEAARRWLDEIAATDSRIVLVHGDASGISAALNRAIEAASGEYLVFLDHDDLLERTALAHVARTISETSADLIYSDEDYVDARERPLRPNFKPDWSPELLQECMYIGHLLIARRQSVIAAGKFDPTYDGAQDYDLALKLVEHGARVAHIPRVLYHWRLHQGSTAGSAEAKPYAHAAGKKAVEASLQRQRIDAAVTETDRPNHYCVRYASRNRSLTLIIPSRTPALLARCLEAVKRNTSVCGPIELMIVHHRARPDADVGRDANVKMARLAKDFGARVIPYSGPFHFARMMNDAAKAASADLLVFMNDDVEPLEQDWLCNLVAPLEIAGIGVTGARLLYPDGTIQHAGIVMGMSDLTGHVGRYLLDSAWWPWINCSRDVTAVSGACLATTKQLFHLMGGFDPGFPNNYNDVDYCLRVRDAGHRVVLVNDARMTHREAMTRDPGTTLNERLTFLKRWGHLMKKPDAFFSPNLRLDREDLLLRFPD
jgi:GT2 family glycosyltransferase